MNDELRHSFYVSSYAMGWWWYPRGAGFLNCFHGRLQFEAMGLPIIGRLFRRTSFEHTNSRVVLVSPSLPITGHFTIVVFEQGKISVAVPGNGALLRSTLAACGFQIIETPPRRYWPRNQRREWQRYGEISG